MKPFNIEPGMLTMRGVFYPTGYMFVMFPTEEDARHAERLLTREGVNEESISLLTPQDIKEKIARATAHEPASLPSAGTEVQTVNHFLDLAMQGHHALLIRAPSAHESEHVMQVLRGEKISYAQKYRHFVIEDLVE